MENNKSPPLPDKKSSVPPPRSNFVPLGTISTTITRDTAGPARLSKLIRPNPDFTLGGVKKRDFKPNIPLTETKTEPTTQHTQSLSKPEQKPREIPKDRANLQPRKQKPIANRTETTQKVSNVAASPFASGPPGLGSEILPRQLKSEVTTSELSEMDFDVSVGPPDQEPIVPVETKKKTIVIEPTNPSHPISLPFNDAFVGKHDHFLFSENELFLVQLPSHLPIHSEDNQKVNQNLNTEEDGIANNLTTESLSISKGNLGKLIYYKSGKVILRIGNFSFEVTQGTESSFLQHAVVVSTEAKQAVELGQIRRTLVCTPDIDSLVQSYSQHKT